MRRFFYGIYKDIYSIGEGYRKAFAVVFSKTFGFLFRIIKKVFLFIGGLFVSLFKHIKHYFTAVSREGKQFFSEFRNALPTLKADMKANPFKGLRTFFSYFRKSLKVHEKFNRAALSSVIPVFAVHFLVSFYVAYTNLTFAVDVYVNDVCVGTLENEDAYKQAQNVAHNRFASTGSDAEAALPEYKITLTTVDSIDDIETVADNIISAVSEKTVNACGVYVDGKYFCTVKSEDTFNRVTNGILDKYAEENGFDTDDCTVEFNSDITTLVGVYPDNENILSAEEFYKLLMAEDKAPVEHTVAQGESIDEILAKYSVSESELLSLNPDLDTQVLPEGSVLLIKEGERNISIRATKTYTSVEITDYESVMQYDNSLYVGTTMTIVEGVPGRDVVSYTDTYIDGVLVSSGSVLSRYNANDPVNELIKIGTLGVPGITGSASPRLTRDQGGTFIWPAPDNCFWLSQAYNPSRSHYGIDIVSADDGSCRGRRIVSVADGVVVMATYHYSWGYYIRVDHGSGVVTGYAHALKDSFRVNVGDYVRAGQHLSSIGTTGNSTGYHLHFEVWLDGTRVDPLPYVYSKYSGVASY